MKQNLLFAIFQAVDWFMGTFGWILLILSWVGPLVTIYLIYKMLKDKK